MNVPSTAPSHSHLGDDHASAMSPGPRRTTSSTASARPSERSEAHASASTVPIRSPKRPITAAWTDPARPASRASTAAVPVPPLTTPTLYARADGSLAQRPPPGRGLVVAEPTHPTPVDPAELGFEAIVYA